MSTDLIFGRDAQGLNAYAPLFSTNMLSATLAAATARTITVPSSAPLWIMYVRMEPTGYCWISRTTTAAIPASSSFAASQSALAVGTIEFKRTVLAGDVLSFITPNTTLNIEVEFFVAIP